jgi:hypothetical protein
MAASSALNPGALALPRALPYPDASNLDSRGHSRHNRDSEGGCPRLGRAPRQSNARAHFQVQNSTQNGALRVGPDSGVNTMNPVWFPRWAFFLAAMVTVNEEG